MILTVTLNPTVDRVIEIPDFRISRVNKIKRERIRIAGGKGINVSRMVKILGEETLATGWIGGNNGRFIKESLKREGIFTDFVKIREENRVNITILDPVKRGETHLVDRGPRVSPEEIETLKKKLRKLRKRVKVVVFSGSAPRGVGKDIYYFLIREFQEDKIVTILDTSGEYLKKGLKANPVMVKPNEEEAEQLAGRKMNLKELICWGRSLGRENRIKIVVISRAEKEVIVIKEKEKVLIIDPPPIEPLNAVGSGDALVAGFAVGLARKEKIEKISSLGVAAGAASAESGRESFPSLERINELTKRVKVRNFWSLKDYEKIK